MTTFDDTFPVRAPWRARLLRLALFPMLALGAISCPAFADNAAKGERGIRVAVEDAAPLELVLHAARSSYMVGEPIEFGIEGNRDFYLHLFAEDLESGGRRMLTPVSSDDDNFVPGGAVVSVPGEGVTFRRDTPGRERLTVIGSIERIPFDPSRVKSMDPVAGADWAADVMTGRGRDDVPSGMAIVEFDVDVVAAPSLSAEETDGGGPIVFVSSDCSRCAVEGRMRIGFGADRPGLVTVLVLEPDGTRTELLSREVDGSAMHYVEAVAEAPLGEHSLVAVYMGGPANRDKSLDAVFAPSETKGVRLAEPGVTVPPYAVHRFDVVEP